MRADPQEDALDASSASIGSDAESDQQQLVDRQRHRSDTYALL
jgi:hypothetical protein